MPANTAPVLNVLLNSTFAAKSDFGVGANPSSVTSADVNGDGKLDLITANSDANSVSVLLGNGAGGFAAKVDFAVGTLPDSVISADVNGDGKLDLITANRNSNNVSVLLGNGAGGFGAKTDFGVGAVPRSVTSADVNGDGKLDLITAKRDSNNVSVLLGDGAGSFAAKADFAVGSPTFSVTSADVNGDGKLDLITANWVGNSVSVLLGNGDGSFGAQTNFAVRTEPWSVTPADVNGDGKLDLITANDNVSGTVSVLLNTTALTFVEDGAAKVLNATASVVDADLTGSNYAGAALTLARSGGANAQDVFSGSGALTLVDGGNVTLSGTVIGTATNSGGTLTITFNADATQARVNATLQAIAYSNSSHTPPASVTLAWSFSDGNTGAQGAGGTLLGTGSSVVNITAVNDAPVITSNGGGAAAAISVAENTMTVTTVVATDGESDTRTYSITGGADAAKFTINASTGKLFFSDAPNFETPASAASSNSYVVQVKAADPSGASMTQTLTVNVTDVNENAPVNTAPVITSNGGGAAATLSLTENTTAVTTVIATDADGDARTYTIAGGADAAKFAINNSTGKLFFTEAPNYEIPASAAGSNSYVVQVKASDPNGGNNTQTLTVNVTDVDETDGGSGNGGTTPPNDDPMHIYGSSGIDTIEFGGKHTGYMLAMNAPDWKISTTSGADITLTSIERLSFTDTTIALDINGDAGQIYRLYQAAFDRTPDQEGFGFWIYGMDNGISLLQVSAGFVGSSEFQSSYGQNSTDAELVTNLYLNALHRAPEQAGFDFWMNQLQSGLLTRTQVLTGFSESQECQAQVIGVIQHGIEYTQHVA